MNNLKYLRDISGVTQTELGYMMGASKQSISNYEQNVSQPPPKKVQRAIYALNQNGHNFTLEDVFPMPEEFKKAS